MPESNTASNQAHLVQPLQTVVDEMLTELRANLDSHLKVALKKRLKDKDIWDEFQSWLNDTHAEPDGEWFEAFQKTSVEEAISKGLGIGCLQIVVLAYLPGPRYFRGAFIQSGLRKPEQLAKMKDAIHVPHLSGAVGWMTANLLRTGAGQKNGQPSASEPPNYIALQDAQLDIRGRVAVSDYQLGNRSVAGFPVSTSAGNTDLESISGFAFVSHPLAGLFPNPNVVDPISEALSTLRKHYEATLANAIESYIFRHYAKFLLHGSEETQLRRRVPPLTLSADDPTGFLASILFESDPTGQVSAECDVNEDVFLETTAWYLHVANMYPQKWAPEFVRSLAQFGDLIENPAFDAWVPMAWYPRSHLQNPDAVRRLYPSQIEVQTLTASLHRTGGAMTWPDWHMTRTDLTPENRIDSTLAKIMRLYETPSDHAYQADLIVPVVFEQEAVRNSLGFFRINCDASSVSHSSSELKAFHNLWEAVSKVRDEINPEIGKLLFNLEAEGLHWSGKVESLEEQVRMFKRWIDVSHLITEWLADRMHQLVALLTGSPKPPERRLEYLIGVALQAFNPAGHSMLPTNTEHATSLGQAFDECNRTWEQLINHCSLQHSGGVHPEVTLVSFWPRMRLPVLERIDYTPESVHGGSPDDEFAGLLIADPGLLRIVTILVPILQTGESIDLLDRTNRSSDRWGAVDFGVPAAHDISSLMVRRQRGDPSKGLILSWSRAYANYEVRLTWNWQEGLTQPRRLGFHALSNVRGAVARRLGDNLLAGLRMKLSSSSVFPFQFSDFDTTYHYAPELIAAEPELERRIDRLESTLLFGADTGSHTRRWRIRPLKSHPCAFLAALCDPKVDRPMVLAFRDYALANAKAFYLAREYDSQKEVAVDLAHSLSAVAHGYKGPVRQIISAVSDARKAFWKNQEKQFLDEEMEKLETMALNVKLLADDAIFYAWRKERFTSLTLQRWEDLRKQIEQVVKALDLPREPKVRFNQSSLDVDIRVASSPDLWRHLLSKLLDNGLEHGIDDPKNLIPFKVLLRPDLDASRLVLTISNFVFAENLSRTAARVRAGLVAGRPDTSGEVRRGYGLIEAFHCCELLRIDAKVDIDEQSSQLVISLCMVIN